jgi:hypothetical protein
MKVTRICFHNAPRRQHMAPRDDTSADASKPAMRAPLAALSALLILTSLSAGSHAAEVTELNDSTLNGVPSTPLATFLPGESVAAWFTASCTGEIVAAQVYWASQLGGAPSQLEHSITIFGGGAHPTPGPVLINQGGANAVVLAPTLADGIMNEFRYLDPPTDSSPMRVPVAAGQDFVVSLEFLNQSSGGGPFVPAPTIDQDGCQAATNAVDVSPGGWNDACPLGATGDFVIRAVVECSAPVPLSRDWSPALLIGIMATIGLFSTRTRKS